MSDLQADIDFFDQLQEDKNDRPFGGHLGAVLDAARRVANGEQTYRCSQHGFRATPRCNDNPACSLQLGVWFGITTEDTDGIHDWCNPEKGLHGSQCTVPEAIRIREHQRGITTEDTE